MNAIVNGCRPYVAENRDKNCGDYLVNLGLSSTFTIDRGINKLAMNTSCTYRAWTTCGYPSVQLGNQDEAIANDFDIAFAYYNDIPLEEDLDGWNFTAKADFTHSMNSTMLPYGSKLSMALHTNASTIPNETFNACNGTA